MEDIKAQGTSQNLILCALYSRLKNLVYDDIPSIEWEKKYDIPKEIPKDELMKFEPE